MMRRSVCVTLFLVASCSGIDDTPVWTPGPVAPKTYAVPEPREIAPQPPAKTRIRPYRLPPSEPSVTSKTPIEPAERRSLQDERQYLNAEIKTLERRALHDDDDVRAVDARRLRNLKARQRSVVRRLRGD